MYLCSARRDPSPPFSQMRQLPPKEHVENDAKGLLKLLRRVSETVGNKSSKDSSSRQSEKTHSSSGLPRDTSDEERCSIEDISFDANVGFLKPPPPHTPKPLHSPFRDGYFLARGSSIC